jgi:galactose-1-phosphate uridylyltransferase
LSDLSIIVEGDDTTLASEAMRSLPRQMLVRSDGRPPLLHGPTGPAQGRCEVVLSMDRHDSSFGELSPIELTRVIAIWIDRGGELWADPAHAYVCVFENRGAEVGAMLS